MSAQTFDEWWATHYNTNERDKIMCREAWHSRDAEVAELKALSVTNVMIDIVPGDGSGQEVYAKSVSDVENALGALFTKMEAENDALQAKLTDMTERYECNTAIMNARTELLAQAQAKLTEAERLNKVALDAMKIADEELKRKRIFVLQINNAVKEIEKGMK